MDVGQGRSEHREDDRVDRGPSGLMLFGELQERELNANFAIISYELKENGLVFEDLERIYRQKKKTWSICFNSFSSSRSRQSSREPQSPFIPSDEIFHHTVFESCPSGWIVGQLGWIALFLVGLSQGREMLLLSNHFLVNTRSSVIKSHETSESA